MTWLHATCCLAHALLPRCARILLLTTKLCLCLARDAAQVADLGLSRDISGGARAYYRMRSQRPLPLRWMAPEAITTAMWTVASDVWAYGVLLWELTHQGALARAVLFSYGGLAL